MAVLDKVLATMQQRGASAVSIVADEVPKFVTARGALAVVKNPLSDAKAIQYLSEIAPLEVSSSLQAREDVQWSYQGFLVKVSFASGKVSADLRPAPTPAPEARPAPDAEPVTVDEVTVESVDEPPAPTAPAPAAPSAAARAPSTPAGDGPPIDALFRDMIGQGASDLHLRVGEPPMLRLDGEMKRLQQFGVTDEKRMKEYLDPIAPARNREEFASDGDTDFAYEIEGLARFRCNYLLDRHGPGAVFRQIPAKILTAEDLNLSKKILDLCWLSKGFVVVTGPTGSGKSTTLAAMVDYINKNRSDHMITVEDPIEFVHPNKKCLMTQREVGVHTQGFKRALRAALREDPDIVLVGEMRDLETIEIAIETAETGHLVFGTLHTTTAPSTVDRIIDQFPTDRQSQIRVMLSESLKGVIAQTLCRKIGGGRVAALEVLLINKAISNLIREGKTFQIPSLMQTQKALGNVTLNESLFKLVKDGIVEPQEAYVKSVDKTGLLNYYKREQIGWSPDSMGEAEE